MTKIMYEYGIPLIGAIVFLVLLGLGIYGAVLSDQGVLEKEYNVYCKMTGNPQQISLEEYRYIRPRIYINIKKSPYNQK